MPYINFWKQCFDYQSKTNRATYFWIQASNVILIILLSLIEFMVVGLNNGRVSTGLPVLYTILSLLPMVSLCARRLNSVKAPQALVFLLLMPFLNILLLSALFVIPEKK